MKINVVNQSKAVFYPVANEEIIDVENILNIKFPKELVNFYELKGYGFLGSFKGYPNRIMDPYSIRDFRLQANDYEYFDDMDIYQGENGDRLVFFEQDESALLSMELNSLSQSKIYYFDKVIASSLEEFLEKLSQDEEYFIKDERL